MAGVIVSVGGGLSIFAIAGWRVILTVSPDCPGFRVCLYGWDRLWLSAREKGRSTRSD